MDDVRRVTVVMDEDLYKEIVQLQLKNAMFSRSELIRGMIRESLKKERVG